MPYDLLYMNAAATKAKIKLKIKKILHKKYQNII